jgi:hypothetical protein
MDKSHLSKEDAEILLEMQEMIIKYFKQKFGIQERNETLTVENSNTKNTITPKKKKNYFPRSC